MNWKLYKVSNDNDNLEIDGIKVWSEGWIRIEGTVAEVKDPKYKQDYIFQVFEIRKESKVIRFAAGEFSNTVWGIYLPNETKNREGIAMEEETKPEVKDKAIYDDLLAEGRFSKKKKKGILTLGLITVAWFASWVIFGTPLFGWIPAIIIIFIVRTVYQDKPQKISDGRLRRR